jgi:hypothetical protein
LIAVGDRSAKPGGLIANFSSTGKFPLIAQNLESIESHEVADDQPDLAEALTPPKVDDRGGSLQDFVSHLRADASQDALFYLVRSNTSYDGE